jgi:predicted acylesterase/phospholipase RssA
MRLALVLPGGGACGRWQAAVVKYIVDKLAALNKKIDLICGTSVGGLNALTLGKYADNMQGFVDLWAGIKSNKDIYNGMLQFNNFWDYVGMAGQIFKSNKGKSILDPVGLYHTIDRVFGDMRLKDLKIPVIITTTDMDTGERMIFSTDKNPDYKCADLAKATSAMTLAFPGVELETAGVTDLHTDGGTLRNNPICYAIDAGATHIILVGTFPDAYPKKKTKNNILEMALRLMEIEMHENEETSWDAKKEYENKRKLAPNLFPEIKIIDMYPEKSTGSALNFANCEQWAAGEEFATDKYPPEVIEAFLR